MNDLLIIKGIKLMDKTNKVELYYNEILAL